MQSNNIYRTYIWLIDTIRRASKITFTDISHRWANSEMGGGNLMHRSTFNRYRDAIFDNFGIVIECEKGTHLYYIANSKVLREDTVQNWILSTLSMNNVIQESLSLQDRIFLESVPHSQHLETMVEAMKKGVKMNIRYHKYGSDEVTVRTIAPYFLKQYKRRWYVLSKTGEGNLRLFSFDRIDSATLTSEPFVMEEDFSPREYFADSYGVMRDESTPPQAIVLRAYGNECHYMDDLPIHPSQELIAKGDGYCDYRLQMRPTPDFIAYILSRGKWCKVLHPQSLADRVAKELRESLGNY